MKIERVKKNELSMHEIVIFQTKIKLSLNYLK